jgi:hypothetical protein
MIEIGRRKRNQPAPPHVVHEALSEPNRDPSRQWFRLADDEAPPAILEGVPPSLVVWSSLWPRRPDVIVRFELPPESPGQGTALTWTLMCDEPVPDESLIGHLRKRVNTLINADLRYSLGQ